MPEYLTPGVYYELRDTAPPVIRGLRTDIAGMVGLAERGPLHTPTRVTSWRQFQALFGGFVSYGFLAYAVKGFFENGGRTCFVVRVAGATAAHAETVLNNAAGTPALRIFAVNEGVWGNRLFATSFNAQSTGAFSLAVTAACAKRRIEDCHPIFAQLAMRNHGVL